jgi:hypothetical protein
LDESAPLEERLVDKNHEVRYNAYEEQRVYILKKLFNDTSLDEIAPKFGDLFFKDKTLNNYEKVLELFQAYVSKASKKTCSEFSNTWFPAIIDKGVGHPSGKIRAKALESICQLLATTEEFEQTNQGLLNMASNSNPKICATAT